MYVILNLFFMFIFSLCLYRIHFYINVRPRKQTFDNENISIFLFKRLLIYTKSVILIEEKEVTDVTTICSKDEYKYSVLEYSVNGTFNKILLYDHMINFPFNMKIDKPIFINKILKVMVVIDEVASDITQIMLDFIGPNYNFYVELGFKMNLTDILSINKISNANQGTIIISDSFNNKYKHSLPWELSWEPSIIM